MHTGVGAIERSDARVDAQLRARRASSIRQRAIEEAAVDHDRLNRRGCVPQLETRRGDEPDRRQRVEHRLARQIELVEAVRAEHARAVDRDADRVVLLAYDDAEAVVGQPPGSVQPSRATPNDQRIVRHRWRHYSEFRLKLCCRALPICRDR